MATGPPPSRRPLRSDITPGSAAMAAAALGGLAAALETYRGRDRLVRTLCYGCQLAGGTLAGPQTPPSGLPGALLAVSAQLSACRTILRLFDDVAMLSHSCSYGLGPELPASLVPAARKAEAAQVGKETAAASSALPSVLLLHAPHLRRNRGTWNLLRLSGMPPGGALPPGSHRRQRPWGFFFADRGSKWINRLQMANQSQAEADFTVLFLGGANNKQDERFQRALE
ncbi:peroxisomal membrane protein 11C isoform X2 [Cuculus canorus]|uniref:peroxisomal membrane protein 11C isoform X2 n=1 Tax=Cuculus canorus TaxID=55661 RepID=UPI0023AAF167|nr:peroxisomal membrane protein 11C isoform X2 [Cuculus canorus]